MSDPIHLFRPQYRTEEVLAEIRECLERGWTGLGYKTLEIEQAWCRYTGLHHAHFVASATAGLQLALRVLGERDGWKLGDEVITTALTFVSTNHVILHEGLVPVFADVDEYLCLDPASVEERITPRTRAVMFVGMGGNSGRLSEVAGLCRSRGLRLILDAAHMAGTRVDGRHVGGEADAAVFSFHAVKNVPTADSGMVCFTDGDLDAQVRQWSWLGIDKDTYTRTHSQAAYRWMYDVPHVGFKAHGNSVMAAMALVALKYMGEDNVVRRKIAEWYEELLVDIRGVATVAVPAGCESSRHLFQVLVDDRDRVMVELNKREIYPGVHYRLNTDYPMYRGRPGPTPRAAGAAARVISLPMHLGLDRRDVERVAGTLREIAGG